MCTASWIYSPDSYSLLFNRDEKRARKSGAGPQLVVEGGARYLAPSDGEAGGTWIATNEFGVTVCLLNGANLSDAIVACTTGERSRGLLVRELAPLSSIHYIRDFIGQCELAIYMPFTIAAFEPGKPAVLVEWNGSTAVWQTRAELHSMVTSSSFDTTNVRRGREVEYRRRFGAGQECDTSRLLDFHRDHFAGSSPYSACMHRPDACTVSFCQIDVGKRETELLYHPGAPCSPGLATQVRLSRV